jgi:hypothetical protein
MSTTKTMKNIDCQNQLESKAAGDLAKMPFRQMEVRV